MMSYGLWVKMQKMNRLHFVCFLSFWILAATAPLVGLGAVGLKPGIYHNLKLTEPIVLQKGSYTFIGLEMSCTVPPSDFYDSSKRIDIRFVIFSVLFYT